MYTPTDRERLRDELLERAAADVRLTGVAVTGSAADGREDEWSDIDLAFGVSPATEVASALADWTSLLYERHEAVDHLDIRAGAWIYRVFLLANGLQVDLAFVEHGGFRPLAPTFRLVAGRAGEASTFPAPAARDAVGYGWLYALHVRSSLERGKAWQAEHMVTALRNQAILLACLRHGLPAMHGKGADALPEAWRRQCAEALPRSLELRELGRAFGSAWTVFLAEAGHVDAALAARLEAALAGGTRS